MGKKIHGGFQVHQGGKRSQRECRTANKTSLKLMMIQKCQSYQVPFFLIRFSKKVEKLEHVPDKKKLLE